MHSRVSSIFLIESSPPFSAEILRQKLWFYNRLLVGGGWGVGGHLNEKRLPAKIAIGGGGGGSTKKPQVTHIFKFVKYILLYSNTHMVDCLPNCLSI